MRLTESGNARSEQLLVMPTESLSNREWLPGELLNGSEHQRPGWFLDMKYQTCYKVTLSYTVRKKTTNKKVKIFSERDTVSYSTSRHSNLSRLL